MLTDHNTALGARAIAIKIQHGGAVPKCARKVFFFFNLTKQTEIIG